MSLREAETCGSRNYLRIRDLWLLTRTVARRRALLFFAAARELDAELFQLAVQVRALEPDAVGDAAHVSAFLADVMLEINALECVARFAQRQIRAARRRRNGLRRAEDGSARSLR